MSLSKQKIQIPLGSLNESVDDKMLPEGSFTVLENARFDKQGRISKRFGYTALSMTSDDAEDTINSGQSLLATNNSLLLLDGNDAWVRRQSEDSWSYVCPNYSKRTTISNFYGSIEDKIILDAQSNADGSVECCVYTNKEQDGLWLMTYDIQAKALVDIYDLSLDITAFHGASVVYGNGYFCVFAAYTVGGNTRVLGYRAEDNGVFQNFGGTITQYTMPDDFNPTSTAIQAIEVDSDNLALVYERTSPSPDMNVRILPYDNLTSPVATTTFGYAPDNGQLALSVDTFTSYVYVSTVASSSLQVKALNSSTLSTVYSITYSSFGMDVPDKIISYNSPFNVAGGFFTIGYEYIDSSAPNNSIVKFMSTFPSLTSFFVIEGIDGEIQSAHLMSQFSYLNDRQAYPLCVVGYSEDSTQSTNYLVIPNRVDDDLTNQALVVSRFNVLEAGDSSPYTVPPRITSANSFICTKKTVDQEVDESPTTASLTVERNIQRVSFENDANVDSVLLNGILQVAGGPIRYFDGGYLFSGDFNNIPVLRGGAQSGTGGSISDGQYQYIATYELIDANGDKVRSATSTPISVTVSDGTSTSTVDVGIKEPFLLDSADLDAQSPYKNCIVKLYRTTNLGTTFYLVWKGEFTSTVTDGISDSDIADEEVLYTTGGEISNSVTPDACIIKEFKNRLWMVASDDKRRLFYSKPKINGEAVGFSPILSTLSDDDIVAISTMGDNLYVFTENNISFITGNPPDSTGNNSSLSDLITISTDIGCINARSVVKTDSGIFFRSNNGIHLLGPSNTISDIGSLVEDSVKDSTIVRALHNSSEKVVYFLTSEGEMLVFNHEFGVWSIYTLDTFFSGVRYIADIAIFNGKTYLLSDDGRVYEEDSSTYKDKGAVEYSLNITTGWINLAGLNQLQRVYDIYLLGNYKDSHNLNVKISYDYDDTVVDTKTWSTATGLTGGDTNYQIRIRPSKQKIEAIKINIYDDTQSGTSGSFEINQLSLVVGTKGSNRQLPSIKNI